MKDRDIIIIASQAWDIEIGSNCKNIAIEFAKQNRVLYVNPPLDRITIFKKYKEPSVKKRLEWLKSKNNDLHEIGNNIWTLYPSIIIESINWLKPGFLYNFLNKINNRRLATQIKKVSEKLSFINIVVFNDSYMFGGFFLKELLLPALHLYYIRDNLISQPYFKRHGSYLEPQIIEKSDFVFANSTYLQEYASKYNLKSSYVGQGCELDAFENSDRLHIPENLQSISYPIIGYIGFITSMRLDIELLRKLAMSKPNWNIVLVGPTDQKFKESKLGELNNIHFLGSVANETVPNYIKGFDVCINPQLVNDLTIGNYPRKIDEYLAFGKPVVATHTKTMEIFAAYTYLADNAQDYLNYIEVALHQNENEIISQRKKFAKSHTWEESVKLIYQEIESKMA